MTSLRQKAEERLRAGKMKNAAPLTDMETKRLLHELQVHQVELEMQNEELQQARAELEKVLERYTELYDFAPVGYITLDRNGMIRKVNLSGAGLLGADRSQLMNRRFDLFLSEESRPAFNAFLQRLLAGLEGDTCESMLSKEGMREISVQINATVSKDGEEYHAVLVDISGRKQAENDRESEIDLKNRNETNTTVKVLLATMENDETELKESFLANIKEMVLPYLEKLEKISPSDSQRGYIRMIETHLNDLASPFVRKLTSNYLNFTKKEIQIAALIRDGKTTKEIAELLNASKRVIDFHRENIREKLGLKNNKGNLSILLRSFS